VNAPTAFRQQLLGTMPRLRRYARSLVFDASAADDLVQTALERALAHWHQFDQRRDILVWVISIAHNAFMDDRRRHARMPSASSGHGSGHGDDALSMLDTLAAPSVDVGLQMDLNAAIGRLSVEHREPLLLVAFEQFSYAECAEALQIPIGTVMSRVSRARAVLRGMLDGSGAVASSATPSAATSISPGLRRVI
jgi:RNA polymerase sigma-70 factor (ECF subfamily)